MPLINQVPESAPTKSNIIIGELIDLMFFDTFSKYNCYYFFQNCVETNCKINYIRINYIN